MREGTIEHGYLISLLNGFMYSDLYKVYPTHNEQKEFVSKYFRTFHVDGDPVTWTIETVMYLKD